MARWIPLTAPEPGLEDAPQPIIDIHVFGPSSSEDARALVDTGSSYSVFPLDLLERLGVNFTGATSVPSVVGSGAANYLVGDEHLIECHHDGQIALARGYASEGAKIVMLGVNDFLRFFNLTVEKCNERFRLDPCNHEAIQQFRQRSEPI